MVRKRKRTYKLGFLLLLSFFFVHFYAPRFITEIKNPIVYQTRQLLQEVAPQMFYHQKRDKKEPLKAESFTYKGFEDTEINGFFAPNQTDTTKATIVMLHGIHSHKGRYADVSKKLTKKGFNCVAIDLRAHGKSGGQFCTFGVKEKEDVKLLIDYLIAEKNIQQPIGIWGHSLGGATALESMAIDKRIKFGVVESAYRDFLTIANDYSNYYLKFAFQPLTNYMVYRAGKLSNFNPELAKPIEACKQVTQPLLLVHGENDQKINIKYGKENFEALASTNKTFLPIENGSHDYIWEDAGETYHPTVFKFFEQQADELAN